LSGLTWPLADDMTDEALEDRLYANAGTKQGHRRHAEPDWARSWLAFTGRNSSPKLRWMPVSVHVTIMDLPRSGAGA